MNYKPTLRRNSMRRGPLKLTTVELPPSIIGRVRQHAAKSVMPMRTVWHRAMTEYLDREGA